MDFAEEKAVLRKQVIAARNAMDSADRASKSQVICQQVVAALQQHFAGRPAEEGAPVVGLFSALGSEVDLRDVVRQARDLRWRVALPVMLLQEEAPGYTMVFVDVPYDVALERTENFLAKPAKNIDPAVFDFGRFPAYEPAQLDALVLPLVAFDAQGGRLGYGGGNYDRYLPQLRSDCWLAGVAFDEQQVPAVPRAGFDLALPQYIHA